jgi:hypothetical protein
MSQPTRQKLPDNGIENVGGIHECEGELIKYNHST